MVDREFDQHKRHHATERERTGGQPLQRLPPDEA
jgi:hypothetical protein